ncbi:TPA: DUF551 domain-containing protein [Klebsiella pneumoniae]
MTRKLTITDERIISVIERLEYYACNLKWTNVRGAQDLLTAADGLRELQERRKAAMDSEPVAYRWNYGGTTIWRLLDTKPGPGSNPRCPRVIEPLYRHAQPAPVVPDNRAITQHFDTIALETAREILCDVNRRHEFLGGEVQLLSRIQCRIDAACRAAMPQENPKSAGESNNCRSCENVQDLQAGNSPAQGGSRCSIKAAPALDSSPKTADARCGSSPVIPDCWIPVSEQMPGSQEWVIVFAKWANQQVLCWDDVQNRWTDFEDQSYYADMFSHWMPLPAAPQEVNHG